MFGKVSIIVPVYNVEKYIDDCVKSLLDQTYDNIEVILVDDGSRDSSGVICDNYAGAENRIKVIHKDNGGLVSARKAGVDCATGDYIFNLDGDDWIELNTLEILVERMNQENSDIVQCGCILDGGSEDGKKWISKETSIKIDSTTIGETILPDLLQDNTLFNTYISTKLYRTSVFKSAYKNVPDTIKRADDFVAFIEALKFAKKITLIPDVCLHYRIREDSKSRVRDGISQIVNMDNTINHIYQIIKGDALYGELSDDVLSEWVTRFKLQLMCYDLPVQTYLFPTPEELLGKNILIYGAGVVGRCYYAQLSLYKEIRIVGWIDRDYEKYNYPYCCVRGVESITEIQSDFIVVAVKDVAVSNQIRNDLVSLYGVQKERILVKRPESIFSIAKNQCGKNERS